MRLRSPNLGILSLFFLAVWVLPGGAQSFEDFRYQRAIYPGGAGVNRLPIDLPLLAGASPFQELVKEAPEDGREPRILGRNGLGDLRIYDSANREAPYRLAAPPAGAPDWIETRLAPEPTLEKTSGFVIDPGRAVAADRMRLAGIPAPWMKSARLEGSVDQKTWTVLVEEGRLFDLPSEKLQKLELEFPLGAYRYFRLTWDDSASVRLPLPASASVRLVGGGELPPQLRVPLRFRRGAAERGISHYLLRLPARRLPIVAIEISTDGVCVLRKTRIMEVPAEEAQSARRTLGMASLWHIVFGKSELQIEVIAPLQEELDLAITDGNNPPLHLTGVSAVFASLPWIYFVSPGAGPLTARFGSPGLTEPHYDFPAIDDSNVKEAAWGDLQGGSGNRRWILWMVAGIAAIALIVVLARKIR